MEKRCGNCKYWVATEYKLPDGTTYSYEDEQSGNCVFQVPEWVESTDKSGKINNARFCNSGGKCSCYSLDDGIFNSDPGEKWLENQNYVPIVSGHKDIRLWRRPFGWPDVMLTRNWWCIKDDEYGSIIREKSPKDAIIKFAKTSYQSKIRERDEKSAEVKSLKRKVSILEGILEELEKGV